MDTVIDDFEVCVPSGNGEHVLYLNIKVDYDTEHEEYEYLNGTSYDEWAYINNVESIILSDETERDVPDWLVKHIEMDRLSRELNNQLY